MFSTETARQRVNLSFFRRSAAPVILLTSVWLVAVDNGGYWNLISGLPIESGSAGGWFFASVVVFSVVLVNLALTLLAWGRAARYVLSAVLVVSAAAGHFMSQYGILLDDEMIRNIFETDRAEALELLGPGLLIKVTLLGVLPALLIWRLAPARQKASRTLLEKISVAGLTLAILAVAVVPFFKEYASMVRNHREIRYLLTPVNYLHSLYMFAADLTVEPVHAEPVGQDATRGDAWSALKRKVVTVLVVGETARADHFSLGGYGRPTNPRLSAEDIVYFPDVSSCGTATRVSLPCMFSDLGRAGYSKDEAGHRESLLDVLNHAGIATVWLDNNSGCKGVCDNSPTWTAAGLTIEGLCEDGECFDAVLLDQLEKTIQAADRDTVIVLHQNGSHGPAYYRRYPKEFRVFTPDCQSDDFGDCSREEIVNSYDNTILYTDYFLAQVIDRLGRHSAEFDTAMLYVSDHGESLGEYGLYLHGTPYFLAPEAQTRVPMLLWLSPAYRREFHLSAGCLQSHSGQHLSHDNLFHSMLGLLDVNTAARDQGLNLFAGCARPPASGGHALAP